MKRILITIGLIVVVIAIGVGVYFGWKKSQEILSPVFNSKPSEETALKEPKTKLKALSQNSVIGFWADNNGNEVYYLSSDGKVMKIKDDNEEVVSENNVGNVISVKFSDDGKFIIEQNTEVWRIFDLENKKWEILSTTISAADFSPDSKKIVFLQDNLKGYSDLTTVDLAFLKKGVINFFKNQTKILSLTQKDFDVNWISQNKILLLTRRASDINSEFWAVDVKTKTISRFLSGKELSAIWSKSGDLGFGLEVLDNQPKVFLFDQDGAKIADFRFFTFPSKCAIASGPNVFCAIPADQGAFAKVKPIDQYFKRGIFTKDYVVKIDISANKIEKIFDGGPETIDADKAFFAGNRFFFVNRYDNRLYSLEQ